MGFAMTRIENQTHVINVPVQIRLARLDDLSRLEWFGEYTHFRRVFRRTFQEQLQGKRLMIVADVNNFPVGQIFVQINGLALTVPNVTQLAYFYSLRVMEIFQGRGLGTLLLKTAETEARQRGMTHASIAAAKDNPRARELYERLGYNVFSEDQGRWSYRDHRGITRYVHEPCWLLEKKL